MAERVTSRTVDDSAARLRWLVACAGYHWSTGYELFGPGQDEQPYRIREARRGPWLMQPVPAGAEFEARVYEPLRWHRNLHVEFAGLPLGSDEESLGALARFASRYGTLGWGASDVVRARNDESAFREPGEGVYVAEHVSSWLQAISSVRGLLELVQACKRNDTELARRCVRWHSQPTGVKFVYRWPGARGDSYATIADQELGIAAERLAEWSAESSDVGRFIAPLEYHLYGELNRHLREHTALFVSKVWGGRVRVDSLLGAFYVMLAEQLSGTWRMNLCESCGKLFVPPSRSDQKTCSAACRQRMSRRRTQAQEQS